MARTVDYSKKAEKIKEQVDELVQELMAAKSAPVVSKRSLKVADIDFESEDVNTLMQIQARLADVYVGEEQIRKNSAKVLIKAPFPLRLSRERRFIFQVSRELSKKKRIFENLINNMYGTNTPNKN